MSVYSRSADERDQGVSWSGAWLAGKVSSDGNDLVPSSDGRELHIQKAKKDNPGEGDPFLPGVAFSGSGLYEMVVNPN